MSAKTTLLPLTDADSSEDAVTPDWRSVEELLDRLSASKETFPTTTSDANWISAYDRDRRLRIESGPNGRWVDVADIKTCWETFERLGRITREDVLDPGRCSAVMLGLFRQLAGTREEDAGDKAYLVLVRSGAHA